MFVHVFDAAEEIAGYSEFRKLKEERIPTNCVKSFAVVNKASEETSFLSVFVDQRFKAENVVAALCSASES